MLISPNVAEITKTTTVKYPENIASVCDKDWRYDNPFTCGAPANYTHVVYAKWYIPGTKKYYYAYSQLWDKHPPKYLDNGMTYAGAWLGHLELKVIDGNVNIKIHDSWEGVYLSPVGPSYSITPLMEGETVRSVDCDIAQHNNLCSSGSINVNDRPLISFDMPGSARLIVTFPDGKSTETILNEGDKVNYARLLFDNQTGTYGNCVIENNVTSPDSP